MLIFLIFDIYLNDSNPRHLSSSRQGRSFSMSLAHWLGRMMDGFVGLAL